MGDYHSWLDNIAAADMRASKYFVDKVQILYTLKHPPFSICCQKCRDLRVFLGYHLKSWES